MAREVPWTLRDCVLASLPAALLFGWSAIRRLRGLPSQLGANPVSIVVIFLITAAVWIIPVYLVAVRPRGARAADLGFSSTPWGMSARLVGNAFSGFIAFGFLWQLVTLRFHIPLQPDLLKKFPPGWQGFALALILAGLLAPFAEETFFRGFLFTGLRKYYPFWIAAGVSAIIFGVGHMVPGAILPLSLLGFLLAWLRERTGSLWPSIALHVINNSLYFAVRFAERYYPHR